MLEVLRILISMFLAAFFVYTAAMVASMGIKKKENRKMALIGAILIELVSFTIWVPSLNDLFNVVGLENKIVAMIVSIIFILVATVVVTIFNIKREET